MLKKMLNLESCSQLESALLKLKEISKLEVSKFEAGNEKRPNEKYTKLTSPEESFKVALKPVTLATLWHFKNSN